MFIELTGIKALLPVSSALGFILDLTHRSQSHQGYSFVQRLWLLPLAINIPIGYSEWNGGWWERCEADGNWNGVYFPGKHGIKYVLSDGKKKYSNEDSLFSLEKTLSPKLNKKEKYIYVTTHTHFSIITCVVDPATRVLSADAQHWHQPESC